MQDILYLWITLSTCVSCCLCCSMAPVLKWSLFRFQIPLPLCALPLQHTVVSPTNLCVTTGYFYLMLACLCAYVLLCPYNKYLRPCDPSSDHWSRQHFSIATTCAVDPCSFFTFGCFFCPQILLLIDIELSYINTNHEDFIGFAK